MQSTVLLALGAYRFAVSNGAYQKFDRTSSWRWPSTERIGMAPAPQYVGPGDDTITIDGVIFPHFRGGLRQIDQMRAQAGLGMPLPLVSGYGRYLGVYVIEKIRETQDVLMSDGAPRKIEFQIELKAYA
ncbi:phage tail protein [Bradyrhizobium retamae]|uniref:Phage tail protein n=1 Tax=Bradyrhizobium retamae TaxID=1300035 RepID=A0A0R3MNI9_9BRAD|nr:phage tail protein [Bradyrhizobium retamae]KRR21719.1 phage tail protein [Bradyrhizobium retamae]